MYFNVYVYVYVYVYEYVYESNSIDDDKNGAIQSGSNTNMDGIGGG